MRYLAILVLILTVAFGASAQTWMSASSNGVGYVVSSATSAATATGGIASPAISANVNGKYFTFGVKVSTAGSSVSPYVSIYGSIDGSTYFKLPAAIFDTTSQTVAAQTTGTSLFVADLTKYTLPYYKIMYNTAGLSVGTTGKFVFYAITK